MVNRHLGDLEINAKANTTDVQVHRHLGDLEIPRLILGSSL